MIQKSLMLPEKQENQERPLSWFQERLWVLNQKNPRDLSYNIPVSFLLEGTLDVVALNRSLGLILCRHESLRARFIASSRGEPVQTISPDERFNLRLVEVQEHEIGAHLKEVAEHVFDLTNGPIFIGRLLRLGADRHLLLLNVHHIAADGWSIEGVLFSELQQCYEAFSAGVEPKLPPLPVQYTDFAEWQKRQDLSADLAYWHESLSNYEDSLELPSDFLRHAHSGRCSNTFVRRYSKEFSNELDRFAQAHGCTLFMCLLAGFAVTVSRYSGKEDLCIGTTTSGRILPELEGLIGFFINILPLRIRVDEEATVKEYLSSVRKVALSGFDHQVVPFERILYSMDIGRSGKSNPLVPLVLRHQNFPHTSMANDLPGGLRFGTYAPADDARIAAGQGAVARCELELSYTGDRDDLSLEVVYAADLYRRETIERLLTQHERVLTSMFADENRRLCDLELLTQADLDRLCVTYNQTRRQTQNPRTFVQRWQEQVAKTPDAIACYDQHGEWSYSTVESRIDALASQLTRRGVRPGEVIGVCMDRGAALLVSLLSIWKVGAAYVPLDPSYPEAYLQQILHDSAASLTICTTPTQSLLGLSDAASLVIDSQLTGMDDARGDVVDRSTPDGLSYLMYTSGSTGKPKGVRVPHRQLINWMDGLERMLPFQSGEVVAQKTTMAFAVSVKELFAGLLNGCALAFVDTATTKDTVAFVQALSKYRVSRMNLVPSHLEAVLTYVRKEQLSLPHLKICITAGEPLTAELVKSFRELLPHSRLLNNYGCTELNDIAYYDTAAFDGAQGFVPIGRPIQNTQLYILDRRGRLVPEGVAGELHVASESMPEGYQNLEALTRERFVKNPFANDTGVLYNTGDVVKYLSDGNLEFIGRWDFQVKVRGFRVDVRHVEKILGEYDGIGQRAVVGDGSQLLAYYVAQNGLSLDVAQLREFLQARLPPYMVPSAFVAMEAMPRLPNGKLDRRALKPSAGQLQRSGVYEAPRTETETALVTIWSEVLEVPEEDIGRQTHFFEIGGHSLSATRLVARIKERLKVEIGLSQIFEHPRLDELSRHVADAAQGVWFDDDLALPSAPRPLGSLTGAPRVGGLLENKVILVTGSSRGIGSATVRLLASQGAAVAINYMHNEARANRARELIEQDGGVAAIFQADMTDEEQVNRMVTQVRERFGKIDALVANAAIGFKISPFLDYDWSDFQRKMTDELKSIFHLCRAVVPEMVQRKSGSIVAVSSSMSKLAERGYIAHSSAKAALDAFVRALAIELGPDGVRVNTVAPGLTLTDATASLSRQHKDAAAARCPLRRNGLPRDVAGAILFLTSDLSEFMTGTYLPVDGGFTML